MDSNTSRIKDGRSRELKMGQRQYALMRTLAATSDWIYLNDIQTKLDTRISHNHKYQIVKDYCERGFLDRRYEIYNNRPLALIRITHLGAAWLRYHELGIVYDMHGQFDPEERREYTSVCLQLQEYGFTFMRDAEVDERTIVKNCPVVGKGRAGAQLALF